MFIQVPEQGWSCPNCQGKVFPKDILDLKKGITTFKCPSCEHTWTENLKGQF